MRAWHSTTGCMKALRLPARPQPPTAPPRPSRPQLPRPRLRRAESSHLTLYSHDAFHRCSDRFFRRDQPGLVVRGRAGRAAESQPAAAARSPRRAARPRGICRPPHGRGGSKNPVCAGKAGGRAARSHDGGHFQFLAGRRLAGSGGPAPAAAGGAGPAPSPPPKTC